MIDNVICHEALRQNKDYFRDRKYVKDSYQLAVTLQHKRNASFREAALCVEAARSLVNAVAIISGQRDP